MSATDCCCRCLACAWWPDICNSVAIGTSCSSPLLQGTGVLILLKASCRNLSTSRILPDDSSSTARFLCSSKTRGCVDSSPAVCLPSSARRNNSSARLSSPRALKARARLQRPCRVSGWPGPNAALRPSATVSRSCSASLCLPVVNKTSARLLRAQSVSGWFMPSAAFRPSTTRRSDVSASSCFPTVCANTAKLLRACSVSRASGPRLTCFASRALRNSSSALWSFPISCNNTARLFTAVIVLG
mmetsp:Transcript_77233/g.153205  ORF Transcript_77233/g.153205 Transcript_77233/m.153205 type:complete len:244 (-) Transcript_77233:562-1293(-)